MKSAEQWDNDRPNLHTVEDRVTFIRQIQADALRTVLGLGGASDIAPSIRRTLQELANQLDPIPTSPKNLVSEPSKPSNV